MSTYTQSMYIQNNWNSEVTVWVAYTFQSSNSTTFLYAANLAPGGKTAAVEIFPQSGKTDYFTVTFIDGDANCWGIPFASHVVSLPNQDGVTVGIVLDANDQNVEFHLSTGGTPATLGAQLRGSETGSD